MADSGALYPLRLFCDCHGQAINQSHLFIKAFVHQQMSQNVIQKPSLKPQSASNADVEARWLGKTP